MKLTALLSLCLAILSPAFAADAQLDAQAAYKQAVDAYVEAAGKEMLALKTQVAETLKTASEARKAAYEPVVLQLRKCEAAYDDLKAAAPKDFDRAKALYETRRKEALKILGGVEGP